MPELGPVITTAVFFILAAAAIPCAIVAAVIVWDTFVKRN